jgi:UDP-N-acetylmuramoyl-tripeptide--D-alanyl-D-alanine ligase
MERLDLPTLTAILGDLVASVPDLPRDTVATGLAVHTDHLRPGVAFVALAGARGHGIDHAHAALAAGAPFLLSDRPHPRAVVVRDAHEALARLGRHARSTRRGAVVGVTGSVGKTTTKTLLGAALEAFTSPGNINTTAALACVLVDAWLHHDPRHTLVVELGIDRDGEMADLLDLVAPSHGVLTAIAEAHLAGIGDLADVAREKGRLIDAAPAGRYVGTSAWPHLRDDQRRDAKRVGLGEGAPGGALADGARRLHARLRRPDGGETRVDVDLPGPGRPYAEAALLALQVALDLGIDPGAAAARIAAVRPEPHRLELHTVAALTLLDDAYNANPASMRAALEVLAALPQPHAAVIGDMRELGARSVGAHAELGRALVDAGLATVWFVGPESRAAYEAARGLPERRHVADADAVIGSLAELPDHGSLLVKGSRSIGLERLVAALLAGRERPVTA